MFLFKKLFVIVILACFLTSVNADLVHRYNFNGNLYDLGGLDDATLVTANENHFYADGTLNLGNFSTPGSQTGQLNYVDLPNGIISSLGTEATFEMWVTWDGPSNGWQRILDFGTSDQGEDSSMGGAASDYILLTPRAGNGVLRLSMRQDALQQEVWIDGPSELVTGQEVHIVITWKDNDIVRMYVDGAEIGSGVVPNLTLGEMNDNNNWLGRSQWPDPAFNGSYNEFRIYDSALTVEQIQYNFEAGPDSLDTTVHTEKATSLQPDGGALIDSTGVTLTWVGAENESLIAHRIFLGDNYDAVLNAVVSSTGIYRGATLAGTESFVIQSGLEVDKTYYWRIDEYYASGSAVSSDIASFRVVDYKAHIPTPIDGKSGLDAGSEDITLEWVPGEGAVSHKVWFGTNASQLVLLTDYLEQDSWVLEDLDFATKYYWRIDERNAANEVVEGELWSFSTKAKAENCITGDLTGDCIVEYEDLVLFAGRWLDEVDCDGIDCPDFDGSDFVDMLDFAMLANNWLKRDYSWLVINEVHYNPDSNVEAVEFVELHNASLGPINLDFWKFEGAIDYVIPANTTIEAGGYLVIAQNPLGMQAKFGVSAIGPWEGKLSNEGEEIVLRDADGNTIDKVEYQSNFPWPVAANGEGASMELINPFLDNNLGGSWRPSGYVQAEHDLAFSYPTPGEINGVYGFDVAPIIRQVDHDVINPDPGQDKNMPKSGQSMLVTAKVTDSEGVDSVNLKLQIVEAGNYIPAYKPVPISVLLSYPYQRRELNPDFEKASNWSTLQMNDDGVNGDLVAGDSVYSVIVSGNDNRTIVRYRIEAEDILGSSVRVPYYDDGSLNFAAFVYDGVPDYTTTNSSILPEGAGAVHGADVMSSLPVYTLITRNQDFNQCNGYTGETIPQGEFTFNYQEAGKAYNWEGCFVYDGKVYDHINYRLRGGNGRYLNGSGGKRSMKYRFNRGSYFQAKDIYGEKYPSKWHHLMTSKMLGNHLDDTYMYGINELINMKMWNIIGLPSSDGWWFTFRVIDGQEETPTANNGQYTGDYYGMYVGWENYDVAYLDNHGMEKGNLYKLSDKVNEGYRQQRYQNAEGVTDNSDYENIRWNMNSDASADFVENHLDLDRWYRFKAVQESVRHYDIFSGPTCFHCLKNAAWYFAPEYTAENNYLGKLWTLPFDVDDTWGPYWNFGIDHATAAVLDKAYDDPFVNPSRKPEKDPLRLGYRNYLREYRDLFFTPEVIDQLIDDYASVIEKTVKADRDRWRNNPLSYEGGSRDEGNLENVVTRMKTFAWSYGSGGWPGSDQHLDNLANNSNAQAEEEVDLGKVPNTPVINYIGSVDYPTNDLQFSVSGLSDPQGNETITSIKWRVAEIDDPVVVATDEGGVVEVVTLVDKEAEWLYFEGTEEPSTEVGAWRLRDYNDDPASTNWKRGNTVIGYDPVVVMNTELDMQNQYNTFYLRKTFNVARPWQIENLLLDIMYDDGFSVWINGNLVLSVNVPSENLPFNALLESYGLPARGNDNNYDAFSPVDIAQYLVEGTNQIAVHLINITSGSSDAFFDMQLRAQLYEVVEPLEPKAYLPKRKYEINADWESEELMTFDSIKIPGAEAKTGRRYRARCKVKDNTGRWSHWSEPVEFVAGMPLGAGIVQNLRITELMYNPKAPSGSIYDDTDFEFIEFKNVGDETIDLSNVVIDSGVTFDFATGSITSLLPGEFVLVAYNQTALESKYGSVVASRIAGEYSGKLSNSGEGVSVVDYNNGTVVTFTYSDSNNWPQAADGTGHSLVPLDSALSDANIGSLSYGFNWRASSYMDGSPAADDAQLDTTVMVNEICAHTDVTGYESNDWIELLNAGSSSVNLSDWYLSDDEDELAKWNIGNVTIGAGELISFDEINDFHKPDMSGFGLSKAGEKLILSYLPESGAQRIVNYIEFEGQERVTESDEQLSWGRYPDGNKWFFTTLASRDSSNSEVVEHVVIREIMYHHWQDLDILEYVMIENPTASSVSMSSEGGQWELTGDADYAFPVGSSIGANSRILVVSFDPTDLGLLQEFMSAYNLNGLTANVDVFGPWSGDLSNATAKVAIEKPLLPDAPDPEIPWVLIDRVWYFDQSPWPEAADGMGKALRRLTTEADLSSTDASTWHAATPHAGL